MTQNERELLLMLAAHITRLMTDVVINQYDEDIIIIPSTHLARSAFKITQLAKQVQDEENAHQKQFDDKLKKRGLIDG